MASKTIGHQESPEITGLLYKKRGGFGKMMPNCWQYRLFILSKEGVLTYYDTEVPENKDIFESKERGRLDLRGVKSELTTDPTEGAPTPFTIVIQPDEGEKWKLCADTKEDHARWWKMIEKFISDSPDKGRQSNLNIQSDDDGDIHSSTSTPASKNAKRPSVITKSIEVDGTKTPLTGGQGSPAFSFEKQAQVPDRANAAKAPAVSAAPAVAAGGKKNRLKLTKESAFISQEWIEWSLVLIIVNLCIFGVMRSPDLLDRAVFIIALNVVVAHTLCLRSARSSASTTSTPTAATTTASSGDLSSTASVSQDKKSAQAAVAAGVSAKLPASASGSSYNMAVPVTSTAAVAAVAPVASDSAALVNKKPLAGFTLQQVTTEPKLSPDHTWCKADSRQFNVRIGPDYNRYKKKAPSSAPIYEPFAVDVFCTKLRVDHCTPRFQLLDPSSSAPINVDTHHPHVPPVFVIQIQIPSDPPNGFFTSSDDGPGWAIVMYYRITEDAVNQLKNIATASPAVKLFAEWCEKCTEDPAWRGRFKVINSCTNLDELGIPSAISSYNAKPILIRRTGSIFRGVNDGVKYMEMNIHVHKFATLAKQSIHYISSRCGQMYMQIGFVIEGREDAELPETLFACVAVNKPQEDLAEFIFEEEA